MFPEHRSCPLLFVGHLVGDGAEDFRAEGNQPGICVLRLEEGGIAEMKITFPPNGDGGADVPRRVTRGGDEMNAAVAEKVEGVPEAAVFFFFQPVRFP